MSRGGAAASGKPAPLLDRLCWLALTTASLLVLVTSAQLTPSPDGFGTHIALGLPPCGFLAWSGLPCPACGLTTSFAHLARAQLSQALAANPMGLPLFALTAALLPFSLRHAHRGTSFLQELERLRADRAVLFLVLALVATWAARLIALTVR
jgi:hypothetical protein